MNIGLTLLSQATYRGPISIQPNCERSSAFAQGDPDWKLLQPSDVVIIQPVAGHPYGHMALYGGSRKWYSDWAQHSFWPNSSYRQVKPAYVVYRHVRRKN